MNSKDLDRARQYHRQRAATRATEQEQLRQKRSAQVRAAIQQVAPHFPAVRAVYLFGSLAQPGLFKRQSDIDLAVVCDDLQAESYFWQALENELADPVDLRPYRGAVARAVDAYGECVYEREISHS